MIAHEATRSNPTDTIVPECSHHWVIQGGEDPTSAGVCRHCGALKLFKNYLETTHWGEYRSREEFHSGLLNRSSKFLEILEDDDDF